MSCHPDVRRRVAEVATELDAARFVLRHAIMMHMELGPSPALSRSVGLERLIRDAATAPIKPA